VIRCPCGCTSLDCVECSKLLALIADGEVMWHLHNHMGRVCHPLIQDDGFRARTVCLPEEIKAQDSVTTIVLNHAAAHSRLERRFGRL